MTRASLSEGGLVWTPFRVTLVGTGAGMPLVRLKTGIVAPDGQEEELTEYLCDWPDCPNVATQVLGCVRETRMSAAVCDTHAVRTNSPDTSRATGSDAPAS